MALKLFIIRIFIIELPDTMGDSVNQYRAETGVFLTRAHRVAEGSGTTDMKGQMKCFIIFLYE